MTDSKIRFTVEEAKIYAAGEVVYGGPVGVNFFRLYPTVTRKRAIELEMYQANFTEAEIALIRMQSATQQEESEMPESIAIASGECNCGRQLLVHQPFRCTDASCPFKAEVTVKKFFVLWRVRKHEHATISEFDTDAEVVKFLNKNVGNEEFSFDVFHGERLEYVVTPQMVTVYVRKDSVSS